jgi:hypothetical protein
VILATTDQDNDLRERIVVPAHQYDDLAERIPVSEESYGDSSITRTATALSRE